MKCHHTTSIVVAAADQPSAPGGRVPVRGGPGSPAGVASGTTSAAAAAAYAAGFQSGLASRGPGGAFGGPRDLRTQSPHEMPSTDGNLYKGHVHGGRQDVAPRGHGYYQQHHGRYGDNDRAGHRGYTQSPVAELHGYGSYDGGYDGAQEMQAAAWYPAYEMPASPSSVYSGDGDGHA